MPVKQVLHTIQGHTHNNSKENTKNIEQSYSVLSPEVFLFPLCLLGAFPHHSTLLHCVYPASLTPRSSILLPTPLPFLWFWVSPLLFDLSFFWHPFFFLQTTSSVYGVSEGRGDGEGKQRPISLVEGNRMINANEKSLMKILLQ